MSMEEIIEILFEEVQLEKAIEILVKLNSTSVLLEYQDSNNDSRIDIQSTDELQNRINESSDGALYFSFSEFKLNDFQVSKAGIQLYLYENKCDLSMDVSAEEIVRLISVSDLQKWAGSIAKDLNAKKYYCGIEPASDEKTRFFSGDDLGPLKF